MSKDLGRWIKVDSEQINMKNDRSFKCSRLTLFCLALLLAFLTSSSFGQKPAYESKFANVNGVTVHYLKAGTGKTPLVFLHGFGETSHMWIPMFQEFGKDFTVIAPDLRGIGGSSQPATGYDKKTMAADIHELVKSLGYKKIDLVGHDIGLMVAYAYAAQFPDEVEKLALLEAPIPGIGDYWNQIFNNEKTWHFHFVESAYALPLVKGRERIFLEPFLGRTGRQFEGNVRRKPRHLHKGVREGRRDA